MCDNSAPEDDRALQRQDKVVSLLDRLFGIVGEVAKPSPQTGSPAVAINSSGEAGIIQRTHRAKKIDLATVTSFGSSPITCTNVKEEKETRGIRCEAKLRSYRDEKGRKKVVFGLRKQP